MRHDIGDVIAFEEDAAGRRFEHAGEEIDHCRLAGAVRPDQRVTRAFFDRQIDVTRRRDAAETLFQTFGFEDRHGQDSGRPSGAAPRSMSERGKTYPTSLVR